MKEERRAPVDTEGKLPYEKPTLTWEEPLATLPSLMAGCQKQAGNPPDCSTSSNIAS